MIKSIKLRIYPNNTQLKIINNTLGACNFVKNKFLEYNINNYKKDAKFTNRYDFSKIINKLKKDDDNKYSWLKDISSTAIQHAIMDKDKAYEDFFNHNKGFPKFKSRKRINKESYYFINQNHTYYITKNSVKLPKLKKVRITNGDQLPDEYSIISGRIIRHYDKYYVRFIYDDEYNDNKDIIKRDIKLGIDLGIKDYAVIYDGKFGEFSIKRIDGKLHCYVKLEELSAKWVYKGDVLYTEFYDNEYVSKFKEALCYEIFPYGLPVVLSDGEYSR